MHRLSHQFAEHIPEVLEHGTLYVSMEHSVAIHRCCCGCGNEVVTPLSPTDWSLTYNGATISLHPSIGNWSFDCQSHYWIRHNTVEWDRQWSRSEIAANRRRQRLEAVRDRGIAAPSAATLPTHLLKRVSSYLSTGLAKLRNL